MKWNTTTLQDFKSATAEIFDLIIKRKSSSGAMVICLHGDLGVGKTTATQIIAQELGIIETVNSPTFVIKKIYQTNSSTFKKLIHIDAYRLENENTDMLLLETDFKDSDNLIIIEWPEIISEIIPNNAMHVYIEHAGEGRIMTIK